MNLLAKAGRFMNINHWHELIPRSYVPFRFIRSSRNPLVHKGWASSL